MKNFFNYKKFINFSFFIFHNFHRSYKNIYYFSKIFNFIYFSKNFKVFLEENFDLNDNIFISFWKNGLISNFKVFRWCLLKNFFLKGLSSIIINLTDIKNINKEIKTKNLPLISLTSFKTDKSNDFYIHINSKINNIDNVYFYIILLKTISKHKNV